MNRKDDPKISCSYLIAETPVLVGQKNPFQGVVTTPFVG